MKKSQRALVCIAFQSEFLYGAKPAEVGSRFGERVRIAGFVEEELLEVRARPELPVFRSFERRAARGLGQGVGAEGNVTLRIRVVNGNPVV